MTQIPPFDQAVEIPRATADELMRSRDEMANLITEAERLNDYLADRQAEGFRLRWVGPNDTVVDAVYLDRMEGYVAKYLKMLEAEVEASMPTAEVPIPPDPVA